MISDNMYKQVIVIRSDIRMSKGKAAVQCSHASYSAAKKAGKNALNAWESEGQKKVVLKASLQEILALKEKCKKMDIANALISDAGLTELDPGTITALGIGPDKDEKINKVTGSLPLLK